MKLTVKQKQVVSILKNGGQIIIDDKTQDIGLSDEDGNCYAIQHRTVRKLLEAGILRFGHPPALDFTRVIF
jgi:hypothetical protein